MNAMHRAILSCTHAHVICHMVQVDAQQRMKLYIGRHGKINGTTKFVRVVSRHAVVCRVAQENRARANGMSILTGIF